MVCRPCIRIHRRPVMPSCVRIVSSTASTPFATQNRTPGHTRLRRLQGSPVSRSTTVSGRLSRLRFLALLRGLYRAFGTKVRFGSRIRAWAASDLKAGLAMTPETPLCLKGERLLDQFWGAVGPG